MFVNKQEMDVLIHLERNTFINQRTLAEDTGLSLGAVNQSLRNLSDSGYLNQDFSISERSKELIKKKSPKNAIILAAGFGVRMVPINISTPKALLQVKGECLIERLIRQLKEAGINDITVVAGYMIDSFEYLIDDFGVKLSCNNDYASKNNLSSLNIAADEIENTYIVPADIWCEDNPFGTTELYSWYMVSDKMDLDSEVRVNRKKELVCVGEGSEGNAMIGVAYLEGDCANKAKNRIKKYSENRTFDDRSWEAALYENDKMYVFSKLVSEDKVFEINTYEELRELDSGSNHLQSDALNVIAATFKCEVKDIVNIEVLKKGMTNRSFLFSVNGAKYIMRIPGEGTDVLINRKHEAEVYKAISGKGICDDVVYINPDNGYKITKYLEGIRSADKDSVSDLEKCMKKLRAFHEMKLKVPHEAKLFEMIKYYETLRKGKVSVYRDYEETRKNIFSLKKYIDEQPIEKVLTHMDAVPDNFLFCDNGNGEEELQLTDWEYAAMQDPHVDLAMFSIYSLYEKWQIDRLIDIYFENECDGSVRTKIYCYVAICGLLWSNWCEFKRDLGVEFGEYSLRQYRYAKEFYRYARDEMGGSK